MMTKHRKIYGAALSARLTAHTNKNSDLNKVWGDEGVVTKALEALITAIEQNPGISEQVFSTLQIILDGDTKQTAQAFKTLNENTAIPHEVITNLYTIESLINNSTVQTYSTRLPHHNRPTSYIYLDKEGDLIKTDGGQRVAVMNQSEEQKTTNKAIFENNAKGQARVYIHQVGATELLLNPKALEDNSPSDAHAIQQAQNHLRGHLRDFCVVARYTAPQCFGKLDYLGTLTTTQKDLARACVVQNAYHSLEEQKYPLSRLLRQFVIKLGYAGHWFDSKDQRLLRKEHVALKVPVSESKAITSTAPRKRGNPSAEDVKALAAAENAAAAEKITIIQALNPLLNIIKQEKNRLPPAPAETHAQSATHDCPHTKLAELIVALTPAPLAANK